MSVINYKVLLDMDVESLVNNLGIQSYLKSLQLTIDPDSDWDFNKFPPIKEKKSPKEIFEEYINLPEKLKHPGRDMQNLLEEAIKKFEAAASSAYLSKRVDYYIKTLYLACVEKMIDKEVQQRMMDAIVAKNISELQDLIFRILIDLGFDSRTAGFIATVVSKKLINFTVGDRALCELLKALTM